MLKGLQGIANNVNQLNAHFLDYSRKSINALNEINTPIKNVNDGISGCTGKIIALNQAAQGVSNLTNQLSIAVEPGKKLNSSLADLSAITGVTGTALKEIEMNARASAKAFGVDAATSAEGYKVILSRLDPEIAKNSQALKMMGDNATLLSKQLKGDVTGAAELLSSAMNSYGVSTKDPIAATQVMTKMMDMMSAGAQIGAAELPQVKAAIQESGSVAKASGVAFGELNGAIQVVAKVGSKYGAEGGVAIRNVLGELNQGVYNSPKAIAMLQQSGISIEQLSDKNLTLKQRMELLAPIANNAQKMMLLFGKENVVAGMALAQNTELLGKYTNAVDENGVTQKMANTVMGSYEERMNRIKARFDDYKISVFNATQSFLPYLEQSGKVLNSVTQVGSGVGTLKNLMGVFKKTTDETSTSIGVLGNVKKAYATVVNTVKSVTQMATIEQIKLNLAMYANPVGIVIAAIVALIGIVWLLWEKCSGFREVLFGVWEAAKAVFNNIGVVVERVWNLIIKPVFEAIWGIVKWVFTSIWNVVKSVIGFIVDYYKWLWSVMVEVWTSIYETVISVFNWIWETIKSIGEAIGNFFSSIWNFIKNLFGKVGSFLDEWIVQPIKKAFSGVWDFVVGIFNKIWDGLKKLFKPIIDLWNKIFSSDGMQDVNVAYNVGVDKGAKSFNDDQKAKLEKENQTPVVQATTAAKVIDFKNYSALLGAKGGAGNAGGGGVPSKTKGGSESGGHNNKPTTINLTIHKFQDQIVIQNNTQGQGGKEVAQNVTESLLMSLQSITGNAIAS